MFVHEVAQIAKSDFLSADYGWFNDFIMNSIFAAIERKIRKYRVRYYYKAEPHRVNPIHYLRLIHEGRSIYELKKNKELFSYLNRVIAASDSTGGEYVDYLELFRTVTHLKPKCILECGSGISTCVVAFALKKQFEQTGVRTKFISMEENKFYHDQIVKIFPPELADYVKFVQSDRVERWYGQYRRYPGCHYENVPDYPYDFVFIDGPTERKTPDSPKCFDADFINVLQKSEKKVFGLLDQRISTYWAFKDLIPMANVLYSPIKKLTRITKAGRSSLRNDLLHNN